MNHYGKIQIHNEVFLRKAINTFILFSFYCKQEHNLKTVVNKVRPTCPPLSLTQKISPLCYSLPLELPFLQVSHHSLKKNLPTSKFYHHCSQRPCFLKSQTFKVRIALPPSYKKCFFPSYYNIQTVRAANTGPGEIQLQSNPQLWGVWGEVGTSVFIPFLFAWGTQAGQEKRSCKMRWEELFFVVSTVDSALLQGVTWSRESVSEKF